VLGWASFFEAKPAAAANLFFTAVVLGLGFDFDFDFGFVTFASSLDCCFSNALDGGLRFRRSGIDSRRDNHTKMENKRQNGGNV